MHLPPGEQCYAQTWGRLLQPIIADTPGDTYMLGWWGSRPWLLPVSGGARPARRRVTHTFHEVDKGAVYLTNRRFAVQGRRRWTEVRFADIRLAHCDTEAIELHVVDAPPMRLHIWPAGYYYVLYVWLAYGAIPGAGESAPVGANSASG